MAITGNTIKELKNLKKYCEDTPCEDCFFSLNGGICCRLEHIPTDYEIEKITENFLDKAVIM